jgi:rubrerythrin
MSIKKEKGLVTLLELYKYKQSNREKRLAPKAGTFWCESCDMQLVNEWKKCPICGKRNGIKRYKKEPPV